MISNLWRDYGRVDWTQANCAGIETNTFYPDDRGRGEVLSRNPVLRSVCQGCPVITDCANYAIVNEKHGFWGGLSSRARRDVRRKYNIDEPIYNSPFNDANILAARSKQAQVLVVEEYGNATTD
tara:strand:- start:23 stop:394 length:372 start_codon:yes stop_codon:yes gene_type:complete